MPIPSRAQTQFELRKDDKRVQALLTQLGKMREHVDDWNIYVTLQETKYKVVFQDGREMRGVITPIPEQYDWQHCEYIASGTIIPVEAAKRIRMAERGYIETVTEEEKLQDARTRILLKGMGIDLRLGQF